MPQYHVGGLPYALSSLDAGSRSAITQQPVPSVLLDVLSAQEVTDTFVVPALLG